MKKAYKLSIGLAVGFCPFGVVSEPIDVDEDDVDPDANIFYTTDNKILLLRTTKVFDRGSILKPAPRVPVWRSQADLDKWLLKMEEDLMESLHQR